jgi:kinesin family protein 18/19
MSSTRSWPPKRIAKLSRRRYVFDQVFNMHANQEEVFEKTVLPLLDGVLNGYNATAFAYGVSPPCLLFGSGGREPG